MRIVNFILIFIFIISSTLFAQKEVTKDELIKLYNEYYLPSKVDSILWTSKGNCDAGKIPSDIYLKVENRINFFRLLNRLPTIKVVTTKSNEAQAAAYMMYKNDILDHAPPKTWKCYSKVGAEGAKKSCLGFTDFKYFPETAFITGFIQDLGDDNAEVGHRRWLLNSKAKIFSYGATKNTEALYCVFNAVNDSATNSYIAYPWNGYVPHDLIFSKWSFSIPDKYRVDFSKAKVTITNNLGKFVPFQMFKYSDSGLPDHTLVWKMTSMFSAADEEGGINQLVKRGFIGKEINVFIENVFVDGLKKSYKYTVKIVKL